MTYSISIDPGRKALAWAVWFNGRLVDLGLCRAPKTQRSFTQPAINHMASNSLTTIPRHAYTLGAIERMRHYPGVEKSNPNDLLDLQAIGALVMGQLVKPQNVLYFYPQEWQGGACPPAGVMAWVHKRLTLEEQRVFVNACEVYPKDLRHNLYDASGIGLHLHGRVRMAA